MAYTDRKSSINVKVGLLKTVEATKAAKDLTGFVLQDNVSDIPDLEAKPEQLEVTAIGDTARKFIDGLYEEDTLELTCFYEESKFSAIKDGVRGAIAIQIGEKLSAIFVGEIKAVITGFGVGDVINYAMRMTVEEFAWKDASVITEEGEQA